MSTVLHNSARPASVRADEQFPPVLSLTAFTGADALLDQVRQLASEAVEELGGPEPSNVGSILALFRRATRIRTTQASLPALIKCRWAPQFQQQVQSLAKHLQHQAGHPQDELLNRHLAALNCHWLASGYSGLS